MGQQAIRKWGRGLLGAAINSAASVVTVVIVDPLDFNPLNGGLLKLLSVMGVAAAFGAALFLKQHPLPEEENEVLGV